MSRDFLAQRKLLEKGVMLQATTDTPIALRIRQTGGKAVTSVTVVTGTDIVLIDSDGTTTSTFATDATLGAVRDTINAADNWSCEILDGLRADASVSTLVNGAITVGTEDGVSYFDALVDTSAQLSLTVRLTYDRGVGTNKPKAAHRVHLDEIKYLGDVGTAAMDNLQIFEIKDGVATQRFKGLNVDNTETTINWASGVGKVTSAEGSDLLVRLKDAATFADSALNHLTLVGTLE